MSAKITKRYLDYNGLQYLLEKIKKGIPFILKPTLTKQYDLGQTDKQWKNIYGENVYQNQKQVVDTIKMNGSTTALTNTNGTVVIPTVAGPQGPTGEQGPVGPAAGFGAPTATTTIIADNADPTVSVTASGSNTDKVFAFMFGLPRGYQGATGLQGDQGVQGATGPRGVQGKTGGAGFIASVDRQNFTKADWETYGVVGHQENWSNTTIPSGMIDGDLFVITGCATDTGDGYQLVYKYDPTFRPTNTTLRGTCISSHVIARHAQLSTTNAGTNISITNNKINAEGYTYDSSKGSFAEGYDAYANGDLSHAEGHNTHANGDLSHAEGNGAVADGENSHAEGALTVASGSASHAEGNGAAAHGLAAHAEGNDTVAAGENSHAEGLKSTASGENSHAEGLGTIANNKSEHAQGEYNKSAQAQTGATGTAANAYSIFSVGIGTSDTDRRNAIEIHKNGDIFINGTYGATSGNINYAQSFQTTFNDTSVTATIAQNMASTANDMISHINMIKHTENTSVDTQNMLWRTSNENMYEERCIYTYYIGSYTSINLYLPDDDTTTISNGNFSTFVNPTSMAAFKNKFQYYILRNGTGNTITLTLQSRKKSITTKDNVTSFTLKPSSIIEFSAVLFNSFGYMITYTQYS